MVYHVGRPAMFEGNRFLPETGTPIWKIVRNKTVLADCEPDPLTVATWRLKSLTTRFFSWRLADSRAPISVVAMNIHPQFPIRLFLRQAGCRPRTGREHSRRFLRSPEMPGGPLPVTTCGSRFVAEENLANYTALRLAGKMPATAAGWRNLFCLEVHRHFPILVVARAHELVGGKRLQLPEMFLQA